MDITVINETDYVTDSRAVINQNFANVEESVGAVEQSISNVVSGTTPLEQLNVNTNASIQGDTEMAGSLSVTGNITATKVYNAVYNDYAEFFPRGENTERGDIIALSGDSKMERYVKATSKSKVVVGVHSEEYAHIIGGDGNTLEENMIDYIPISLAGRVHVKVVGSVLTGDYVVPSDIAGVGKSVDSPDELKNSIGIALECYDSPQVGLIKIFVTRGAK